MNSSDISKINNISLYIRWLSGEDITASELESFSSELFYIYKERDSVR